MNISLDFLLGFFDFQYELYLIKVHVHYFITKAKKKKYFFQD